MEITGNEWNKLAKCSMDSKDCFANFLGRCMALDPWKIGKNYNCKFYRNDITRNDIKRDMAAYMAAHTR